MKWCQLGVDCIKPLEREKAALVSNMFMPAKSHISNISTTVQPVQSKFTALNVGKMHIATLHEPLQSKNVQLDPPCLRCCWTASRDLRTNPLQKWRKYSECTCNIRNRNRELTTSRNPKSHKRENSPQSTKKTSQNVERDYQWRCRSECKPSLSVISAAFMAFGRSCLFAKTRSTASRSSSYTATTRNPSQSQCSPSRWSDFDYPVNGMQSIPRSASDAARLWLPQHGPYRYYPPRRWGPECSGNNASTTAESAMRTK